MRKPLSEEFAKSVYAILVEAGADSQQEDNFLHHFTGDDPPYEWRFMGKLGFGGKLRYHTLGSPFPLYVDCYPEDETPVRRAIVDDINQRLRTLQENGLREPAILEAMHTGDWISAGNRLGRYSKDGWR